MDPTTYQTAAARTLPDLRSLHAALDAASTVDPRTIPLLMAAVGLAGEAGEWATGGHDPAEAGDVLWYVAAVCTALGIDMADVLLDDVDPPPVGANEAILGVACMIVEQAKKAAFHGKKINEDMIGGCLVGLLAVLRLVHGDLGPIMAANVAKLQARWPDGFRVQA